MRLAGMITGVFVILEMLVFQQALKLIPQAVFSGILFKIGYDVFDFEPFSIYLKWFVERILDGRRSVSDLQYHRRLCCSVAAEPARHTHVIGFVMLPLVLVLTTSMFECRHNSMSSPGGLVWGRLSLRAVCCPPGTSTLERRASCVQQWLPIQLRWEAVAAHRKRRSTRAPR